jgi:4-hydroxy-tetrahydrodipicolinate synthase
LSRIASVIGICDHASSRLHPLATAGVTDGRFVRLCGDDLQAVALGLAGGHGCLSALANLLPRACAVLQRACADERFDLAREIHQALTGVLEALSGDAGPPSIKFATTLVRPGLNASCRLPMVGLPTETRDMIEAVTRALLADPFWNH